MSIPDFKVPLTTILTPLQELEIYLRHLGGDAALASDYASLSVAVTAIGSTLKVLIISTAGYPDGADCTVPQTLLVMFVGAGTLDNDHAVTIKSDPSFWPKRKIFVGSGTISFADSRYGVFEADWWGASDTGSDVTAEFRLARTAALTRDVATLKIHGTILLNGTPEGPTGRKSRVLLSNTNTNDFLQMLTIEGDNVPPQLFGTVPSGYTSSTDQGSMLLSTAAGASANGIIGCGDPSSADFTGLEVTLRNLTMRSPTPDQIGVDFKYAFGCIIENVNVDQGPYTFDLTEPTIAACTGIVTPYNSNGAHTILRNTMVQGFYNGYEFYEHATGEGNINATGCKVGAIFGGGTAFHTIHMARLIIQNCQRVIKIVNGAVLGIDVLNIEHANRPLNLNPAWQDTLWDIDDENDLGRGFVNWHIIKGHVGPVDELAFKGGGNLNFRSIRHGLPPPSARFRQNNNLAIPDAAWTTIAWNIIEDDGYGMFDFSTFTDAIIMRNGWWHGLGNISFDTNSTGIRGLRIQRNGVEVYGKVQYSAASSGFTRLACPAKIEAAKGDVLRLQAYQNSGAPLNMIAESEFSAVFALDWVGPAGLIDAPPVALAKIFQINTTTLTDAIFSAAYSATLQAQGATSYYWDISSGSLPAGMSLAATGVLSGTPTVPGDYSFTVRCTGPGSGGESLVDTQALTLQVGPSLLINLKASWKLGEASGASRIDSVAGKILASNNSVQQVTGKIGNAAGFASASSRYLSIATHADLEFGDNDFTIGFWFYVDSVASDMALVAKNDDTVGGGGLGREWLVSYAPSLGCMRLVIFDSTDTARALNLTTFGNPTINTWYCYLGWYDKAAHKLRGNINNGTVDELDMTGLAIHAATSAPLNVGRRSVPSSFLYYDGRIDNLNLWKKVLTSGERASFYNSGTGREHPMT